MISQATIDKIFSAMRIEEIIGEYVQLKRAGTTLKGLSPFQDEKTPSFVVSPSKQIWKDFSSGKGGTALSFLMEIEGFSYPEALRFVAKKYGIEVEEDRKELSEEEKYQRSERDLLYKINEVANAYYQEQLWETEEGKAIGLSYFKERELKTEIIQKFQLGYSPEKKDAFTEYALSKGYSKEILEKSGISIFRENSGIDRFRERVIFPIHSFSGRVLGFGARILKSNVKAAKYLNSPETEIYHKSNVLYGLNQSKQAISKYDKCLLVEGYMDVISLHQAGIENVVASSGTALTVEQIKLIKRLTENVTILFDGDKAGIKASFRSIDLLLTQGMNIRVLLFPDGDDPDSFARKHPRDYVEAFIDKHSQDFIDFKAEILFKEADNDPIKKAEAIRDIVKSIAHIENILKQEVYIKEVSTKFQISEPSLFNELSVQQQILRGNSSAERQRQPAIKLEVIKSESSELGVNPLLVLEEKLVELMLKYGNYVLQRKDEEGNDYKITAVEEIINYFDEDDYSVISPVNQMIINEIKAGLAEGELRTDSFFLTLIDEDITKKIADISVERYHTSNWEKYNIYFSREEEVVPKIISDSIYRHKREYVVSLIHEIKKNLEDSENKEEAYLKIVKLTQLKNEIDKVFGSVKIDLMRNQI